MQLQVSNKLAALSPVTNVTFKMFLLSSTAENVDGTPSYIFDSCKSLRLSEIPRVFQTLVSDSRRLKQSLNVYNLEGVKQITSFPVVLNFLIPRHGFSLQYRCSILIR